MLVPSNILIYTASHPLLIASAPISPMSLCASVGMVHTYGLGGEFDPKLFRVGLWWVGGGCLIGCRDFDLDRALNLDSDSDSFVLGSRNLLHKDPFARFCLLEDSQSKCV